MNAFLSLLSYRAFRPDPVDVEETLAARFQKRMFSDNRVLAVSVGKTYWRTCLVTFDEEGKPSFGEVDTSPPASSHDALNLFLKNQRAKHKVRYAAVGIAHGFSVEFSSSTNRLPPAETMNLLRMEAVKVMGESYTPDDMGAVVHHPTIDNTTLRFKAKANEMKGIREALRSAGLEVARMVCEQAQMLSLAYTAFPGSTPDAQGYQMLLLVSPNSSLILPLWHNWQDVHFDPQLDSNAVAALIHTLHEISNDGSDRPAIKIGYLDGGLPGMQDLISSIQHLNPEPLIKDEGSLASFRAIAFA